MIIVFGRNGCRSTKTELRMLKGIGRQYKYFDIDTRDGKREVQRRGLSLKEVRKYTPWVINE